MWEPENITVVGQAWYTHYNERPGAYDDDEEEEDDMSVSKPMYDPDMCDGQPCPGDCDLCTRWQLWEDEEEETDDD